MGAMFTFSLTVGILIIPQFDLLEALFGDVVKVNLESARVAIASSFLAVLLTRIIYKNLILSMISEKLASSAGINVARVNLLFLLLLCLTVATGLQIVGSLLVGFLVIVPAVTARIVSSNMFRYTLLSSLFGIISFLSGVLFSDYLNLLPGPLIVFSGIVVFLVGVIVWSISKIY